MKTLAVVDTNTGDVEFDSIKFGFWDDETQKWTNYDEDDKDSVTSIAQLTESSPELIESIGTAFQYTKEHLDELRDAVNDDLRDMWLRMDALEKENKELKDRIEQTGF